MYYLNKFYMESYLKNGEKNRNFTIIEHNTLIVLQFIESMRIKDTTISNTLLQITAGSTLIMSKKLI